MDDRFKALAQKSHVKIFKDYEQWLKSKGSQLESMSQQVNQKIEIQDNEELLIQRLLYRLQVEELHRQDLGQANEAFKR